MNFNNNLPSLSRNFNVDHFNNDNRDTVQDADDLLVGLEKQLKKWVKEMYPHKSWDICHTVRNDEYNKGKLRLIVRRYAPNIGHPSWYEKGEEDRDDNQFEVNIIKIDFNFYADQQYSATCIDQLETTLPKPDNIQTNNVFDLVNRTALLMERSYDAAYLNIKKGHDNRVKKYNFD